MKQIRTGSDGPPQHFIIPDVHTRQQPVRRRPRREVVCVGLVAYWHDYRAVFTHAHPSDFRKSGGEQVFT